ncbi:MAG TPA: hypothetical protein VGL02_07450, partial [Streptomyces sp.]
MRTHWASLFASLSASLSAIWSAKSGGSAVTAIAERPESDVTQATATDLEEAVKNALEHAGLTFDELAEQARS